MLGRGSIPSSAQPPASANTVRAPQSAIIASSASRVADGASGTATKPARSAASIAVT